MGGTGIADGLDGAAPFLNPATVVHVDQGRFTFSVNFYSLTLRSAPRWFQPRPVDPARFTPTGAADASLDDATFDALPSSLCLFFTTRHLPGVDPRLAICAARTQGDELAYTEEGRSRPGTSGISRQTVVVDQSYIRFTVGPTYAFRVNDALAFGASIHGSVASMRNVLSTSSSFGDTSSFFLGTSHGHSFQASAIVGATYRFGRQTFGLALESPSLHLTGSGGASRHVDQQGSSGSLTSQAEADGSFESQTPMRVGIGTAFVDSWGSAAIDLSYYAPRSNAYRADLRGTTLLRTGGVTTTNAETVHDSASYRGVVNASAGVEINVSNSLSLLGGVSTDLGAVSPGTLETGLFNYFPARSDRVAGSFGIRSRGDEGDLMFGSEISYARGERLVVDPYGLPPALTPTAEHATRVLFVIAGSTSFRAIRRAVEDVRKEVVKPLQ